jgi:predicted thioesterase
MMQKSRTAEATLRLMPDQTPHEGTDEMRLSVQDSVPAVHVTSRITALMELAAARLVQQDLRDSETSVGIAMKLTHAAPALASGGLRGATVRAVASHRAVAGRLHHVRIDAFDESGLIASAEHTRAVVIGRRIQAVARRRAGMRPVLLEV